MAWKLLPTDYTDAVWSGLKRYTQVDNSDGTVSFNDVTTYTNTTVSATLPQRSLSVSQAALPILVR